MGFLKQKLITHDFETVKNSNGSIDVNGMPYVPLQVEITVADNYGSTSQIFNAAVWDNIIIDAPGNDLIGYFQYIYPSFSVNDYEVIPDITNWNTSFVTGMARLFVNAKSFNQDISNWDTSSVLDMTSMFVGCEEFNQDIGNWDTSSVQWMSWMFKDAKSFDKDISNWDTSSVKGMNGMFWNADHFNQDISNWDTSSVTWMENAFDQQPILTKILVTGIHLLLHICKDV